ncbi:MAG: STAS domain-containing protein [Gammaproteobacteria bacterium]|nr:STAS domain-containing protein [Gammaproteobacteria bacterium]
MSQASISLIGENAFLVSGDLLFSTVGGLLEQAAPRLAAAQGPVVDLASVVNCDTAGLALLIEWMSVCADNGQRLSFRNLPQAMVGIARLSNVESLLQLAE